MAFRKRVAIKNGTEGITNTDSLKYHVIVQIGLGDIVDLKTGSVEVYMASQVYVAKGDGPGWAIANYTCSQSKIVNGTERVSLGDQGSYGANREWTLIGTYNRGDTVSISSKCWYTASSGAYHESFAELSFTIPEFPKPVITSISPNSKVNRTKGKVTVTSSVNLGNLNAVGTFVRLTSLVCMFASADTSQPMSDSIGFDATYPTTPDATNPKTETLDLTAQWISGALAGMTDVHYLGFTVSAMYEWYGKKVTVDAPFILLELVDSVELPGTLYVYDQQGNPRQAKLSIYDESGNVNENAEVYLYDSSGKPIQVQ